MPAVVTGASRRMLADLGYNGQLRHESGHAHGIILARRHARSLGEVRLYESGAVARHGLTSSFQLSAAEILEAALVGRTA